MCYILGFGHGLVFLAGTVAVTRYFLKKRARALGISYCGSGIGLFALPPLVRFLLEQYSWRGSLIILAGLMLNCCVLSALYRPFRWTEETEEIDIELNKKDECDKPIENDHPEKPPNKSFEKDIQASPLLRNKDHLSNINLLKRQTFSSTQRNFAGIRQEQMKKLKEQTDNVSQQSITNSMLNQSICDSHASFDNIIENIHRSKGSQMNLDSFETDANVNDQRKRFKMQFIELMFPKELITNMNFVIMMIATFLVGVPSFIPFSMLPDYAISTGTTHSNSAWLLSAMGIGGNKLNFMGIIKPF